MKKTKIIFIALIAVAAIALSVTATTADQGSFTISVDIKKADAIAFIVNRVQGKTWTPATNDLNFGQLLFDSANGVFYSPFYYAIDISVVGGAGQPDDIALSYTEGNNPNVNNRGRGGLGTKATLAVVKTDGTTESVLIKKIMKKVGNISAMDKSLFNGGWPRLYVAIWDGNPETKLGDTEEQTFSALDTPGQYTGTLTVTAVVN